MCDLARAIRRISWGYLFVHFDIHLGNIDILPNFLGYYLLLLGIWTLRQEVESTGLLEPFAIFFFAVNLLTWILAIPGAEIDQPMWGLFVSVIGLYFHFQLQTDIAVIADRYDTERGGVIRLLRTVYTALTTALVLRMWILAGMERSWLSTAVAVVALLSTVVLCIQLFGLARDLDAWEDEEDFDADETIEGETE